MAEKSLREKTVNGVLWSGVDRFSSQGIQFIFNILIARILMPEDYGVVAMLGIFLAISQTFIDSGFANALIRKNDRTEDDYNTVFYFNIAVSILFFAILWVAAPAIAAFYKTPLLTKVTRIVSSTLVINALGAVQSTKLSIDLDFRKKAVISIVSVVVIGIVGLWMALKGYGVWALVAQSIAGSSVRTFLQWVLVRWSPGLRFSWESFKGMFSFGSRLLATGLIDTIWANLYNLVIGKFYSPASLGNYNRAESFATFPSANIYGLVQSVLYPSLCKVQDDTERLRNGFRQFVRLTSFIVFPLMAGLAAVADPFVRLILTDKWEAAIPFLQILSASFILYPLNAINITFPNIQGHSEMYLRCVLWNKLLALVVLLVTIPFGLLTMCWGRVVSSVLSLPLNSYFTHRLIGYGLKRQIADVMHIALLSLVMAGIVLLVTHFVTGNLTKLIVGISVGGIVYVAGAYVFRFEEMKSLIGLLKK